MKEEVEKKGRRAPVIRFRPMIAVLAGVVVLIAGPLALVWKQSYITNASVRLEALTDTLSTLNKNIAVLRLRCERLSSTERIEHLARTRLDLDYPSSDRIVIVAKERDRGGIAARDGVDKYLACVLNRFPKGGRE